MKGRKAFLGAVLFMLSLILLGDWNPGKYVAKPNEEIYGTWVNKDNYGGVNSPQKEIITADGVKKYDKVSDPTPLQKYTKIIDSKWTDAEGNIWYKTYGTVTDGAYKGWTWQGIDKLSKGATVWESNYHGMGLGTAFDTVYYPTKIDPLGENYRMEYRAEK